MQKRFRPTSALGKDLLAILPADRISQGGADRLAYSRDMWPRALLSVRDNEPSVYPPDVIVWPETTAEVAELVQLAIRRSVPLVPYGGGSGVCGGAMAMKGGITIDLKRMNRLIHASLEDHLATFQCGIIGQSLEDQLNMRGLTLGHFPASINCSTLGGWLAARSAGQFSSKYGKIEDMVHGLEVVLGDGRVLSCTADQEPDLAPLIVGSEGTLGIITEATLRVKPLADYRLFRAYEFPKIAAGCEAMRRVMQRGLRPAVLRLYDELDTLMARPGGKNDGSMFDSLLKMMPKPKRGFRSELKQKLFRATLSRAGMMSKIVESVAPRLSGGCMAITGFEGEPDLTEAEAALCHADFLAAGARDLGEEPGLRWYENRYAVSYKMSPLYTNGGFADTLEVAVTWDRLMELYTSVRKALMSRALVMAHFSHAYPEGCSIYFTFAAASEGRVKSENLYDEIWRRGLTATIKAGGTISHHHGVGYAKAAFMQDEHGAAMGIYRQLKSMMDPAGVLNPGKMGL